MLLLLCVSAPLLAPSLGSAQPAAEPGQFHWAYAATFGTGLYRLRDDTEVLVIRVPLQWQWRQADPNDGCCGIRLLLPLTLGFEDFRLDDALENDLPDRVEQVSMLPGVELEFPRTEQWTLRARAQLGWGTQRSGARQSSVIYGAGVRSRYRWPNTAGRPALINGLQWTGFEPDGGVRESMIRLSNGMEFDIPIQRWQFRGHAMRLIPHVLTDWYADTLDVPAAVDGDDVDVHMEWEVGIAVGRERPFSILGFELDRLGIAYRFSDQTQAVRLYVSSIF